MSLQKYKIMINFTTFAFPKEHTNGFTRNLYATI